MLAACNSSDPTVADSDPGENLNDSEFLSEQFGDITERDRTPDTSDQDRALVVDGFNAFSLDVHRALAATDPAGNTVVGGYSLAQALSLAMSGTANVSRTELATLLHVDGVAPERLDPAVNAVDLQLQSRANDDLLLRSANRLFIAEDQPFRRSFLDNAVAHYGAPITTADFRNDAEQIVAAINAWVDETTDGLIERLLEDIDPETVLTVLNATLLDAVWSDTYETTGNDTFTSQDGQVQEVPFFGYDGRLSIWQEPGLSAVEMPYAGDQLAMLVVMPDDLASFEQSLTPAELARITGNLALASVDYALPEWAFEQTTDARMLLQPLGLPAGEMDFSAMLAPPASSLAITDITHKARIEVDENGTRAAAATAVSVGATSVPDDEPLLLRIDKPFWYAIHDRETGLLLFSGRLVQPTG